uniref:Protein kinase domain-containing protein n=1 Tax=Rhizophagus irregularis (strain DAOM 181602 / DAOM 197198 / MUCL 43194) TaxID=747089 RepID=U9SW69_RHIID
MCYEKAEKVFKKMIGNNEKEKIIIEKAEEWIKNWAKSHLILSNKYTDFVGCCGLTQDSSSGNYMLVMHLLDMDLRKYLQKHQCTWEEKIHVVWHLIVALRRIHYNDAIHRDLHSGNENKKNFLANLTILKYPIIFEDFNLTWHVQKCFVEEYFIDFLRSLLVLSVGSFSTISLCTPQFLSLY